MKVSKVINQFDEIIESLKFQAGIILEQELQRVNKLADNEK